MSTPPLVIACDLGRSKLAVAVLDAEFRSLEERRYSTQGERFDGVLRLLVQTVHELQTTYPDVAAVGAAVAARVDRESGRIWHRDPAQDVGYEDVVNLAGWLAERCGLPVRVEGDGGAAALAESTVGVAKGVPNVVTLVVGTYLGSGVVQRGTLTYGQTVSPLVGGGLIPAGAGKLDYLGRHACGSQLLQVASTLGSDHPFSLVGGLLMERRLTGETLAWAAREGDRVALEAFETVGINLAQAIAAAVNIFDPEVVVLTGGAMEAGPLLTEPARHFLETAWNDVPHVTPVRPWQLVRISPLKGRSGLIGAAVGALQVLDPRAPRTVHEAPPSYNHQRVDNGASAPRGRRVLNSPSAPTVTPSVLDALGERWPAELGHVALPTRFRSAAGRLRELEAYAWFKDLPRQLLQAIDRWCLTIDGRLSGGYYACCFSGTQDGRPVVLKANPPWTDCGQETSALEALRATGRVPYVLDSYGDLILMERILPGSVFNAVEPEPEDRAVQVIARALKDIHLPAATVAHFGFPGLVKEVAYRVQKALSRCAEAASRAPDGVDPVVDSDVQDVKRALAVADRLLRSADPAKAVLLHTDPHNGNFLRTAKPGVPDGYAVIDMRPRIGEAAFDHAFWSVMHDVGSRTTLRVRMMCELLCLDEVRALAWAWVISALEVPLGGRSHAPRHHAVMQEIALTLEARGSRILDVAGLQRTESRTQYPDVTAAAVRRQTIATRVDCPLVS